MKKEQFLPAITTTNGNPSGSDWKMKIREIKELGLRRVAIFPTCLKIDERQVMYKLLETADVKEIPFVHIRSDMPPEELDYLVKNFGAKIFNTHTQKQYPFLYDLSRFKKQIFIENNHLFDKTEVQGFGGVCLDFSHIEDDHLLRPEEFLVKMELFLRYKIGCNHISAVEKEPHREGNKEGGWQCFSRHYFRELSQLDYLKNYPRALFSDFIAIEVENSLKEQLQAIDYIIKLI